MDKYEYRIERVNINRDEKPGYDTITEQYVRRFDELGSQGWELIGEFGPGYGDYKYIFKRKIN
ncbi:MAG: hypothetical protein LBD23_12380 [Oscillospiraceae bacterium]|jgi:hypothetical protein|nr:hypothetical protein [Oscillospiraceae bacterium]